MGSDKKRIAGQLRFVLLRDVGQAFITDVAPKKEILTTLKEVSH
jgi:3-dehydroquinate synthetase